MLIINTLNLLKNHTSVEKHWLHKSILYKDLCRPKEKDGKSCTIVRIMV